ncbi:MAG TPA: cytochrome c biogenesis heme-transporting ATPase CcmA [Burkholderiaceae bacterium]|nr:cytochrome c biogenesis heme-transporting ATPase CcmA [Burkholderiaceae bacterium]
MLSAHGLTCVRGERRLFSGLDLAIEAGEWLHVRGENGAGKTSLLRMLAGLVAPAAGEVFWDGQPIRKVAAEYRRNLLFLGHQTALKDDLTALENLQFAAALDDGALVEQEAIASLRLFGLHGGEALPVRFLSAGQKRRVLLARLVSRPARVWVLDEPFTALDVKAVGVLAGLIGRHLAAGGMAVLTSHQETPIADGKVLQL